MFDPDNFQKCFTLWVKSAYPEALDIPDGDTEIIPIDGKAIKGSRGKGKGKKAVIMVSAWSSRLSLVLGQKKGSSPFHMDLRISATGLAIINIIIRNVPVFRYPRARLLAA